jgi:hypothetical protein
MYICVLKYSRLEVDGTVEKFRITKSSNYWIVRKNDRAKKKKKKIQITDFRENFCFLLYIIINYFSKLGGISYLLFLKCKFLLYNNYTK